LRELKRRAEDDDTPNNSMDVRAKQRLCFHVAWLLLAGLVAVSPHVISTVSRSYAKISMEQIINQIKEYVPFAQLLSTIIAAVSVGFAAFGIFKTLRNNQRQTNSQIFLDCVKRYEKILEAFPPKVWLNRFNPIADVTEEVAGQTTALLLK